MQAPLILIAEDEIAQVEVLKFNLEEAGFRVDVVYDGKAAIDRVQESTPDLLVLDWMLPEMSGIQVCRKIRSMDGLKRLPIIMLSARGEEDDRLRGFEMGADDYVVKPYLPDELAARIKAVLRRSSPEIEEERLEHQDIVMDLARQLVKRNGNEVELSALEFRLLKVFISRPGRVLTRDQLIDMAWGTGIYVSDRTVDVSIRRLRKALNEGELPDLIRTVRGSGYSLRE